MPIQEASCRRWIRVLGTVAAIAGGLLAGIAPSFAEQFTDKGVLRLQLGQTSIGAHVPNRIVYQPSSTNDAVLADQQRFTITNKCAAGFVAGDPELVTIAGSPYPLGIGPTSLGVYDNAKGTDCYRISASKHEFIEVRLGKDIKTKGANSISKLELDLELKQDAVFELWVTRGGTRLAKPFVLESGRKQGTTDVASTLGVFKCAATSASDSGPDSGPSDNCRWSLDLDVNTIGDGFDLVATNGEGSAEGGGDFGISAYVSNTLIYLTDAIVGALGCQTGNADKSAFTPAIVNPVNGATCQVTRIDTGSIGGPACASNVGYVMRELPEDVGKGCEILKSSGEQLAAILDVTFPEEAWQGLPDADASSPYYGKPVPTRTWVTFGTSPTKYYPDRCIGTLVTDSNGNQTIDEVLKPGTGYDFITTTAHKEWACILEDEAIYIGNSPYPASAQMQIRQKILFWGDFQGGRF